MKKVSIIIPAYNEEESLPLLYERLKKFPSCKIHSIYSHNLQKAIQMEDYPLKFSLNLFSTVNIKIPP